MPKLSNEEIHTKYFMYRHGMGRKRSTFAEIMDDDFAEVECIPALAVEEMGGVLDAKLYDITSPFDDLPSGLPMTFVILVDEKHYLVNTEGYDYCRYITPCVIVN